MRETRIALLDVARGIGIVCVFLGHNVWSESQASAIIFNFHMPLFYFLSGVLFSCEKYGDRQIVAAGRKVADYIIMFIFFSALACIAFLVSPELLAQFSKRMLFLLFVHGEPWYDKPLWFFVSLAFVFFVFSRLSRFLDVNFLRRGIFLILCVLLSFAITNSSSQFRTFWSPAMVATVPFGLFWFGLGHFSQSLVMNLDKRCTSTLILLVAAGLLFIGLSVGTGVVTKPDIRTARMGSWLLFPRSICGIAIIILLAKLLTKSMLNKPLSFVGRNSLVFFALEFVTFPFVSRFLGILVPSYGHFRIAEPISIWQCLVTVIAQLVILSVIAPATMKLLTAFRRCFPYQYHDRLPSD